MINAMLTEQDKATLSGPRDIKRPGDLDWCWQTISALQSMWKSLYLDFVRYQRVWQEVDDHRIWEKIPPGKPYGSKEAMIERLQVEDEEVARSKVAAHAIPARALHRNGGLRIKGQSVGRHTGQRLSRSDYLTARIARDRPDIWERMKNGEFSSVAAAARESGIQVNNPKRVVMGKPAKVVDAIRQHYTTEERIRIAEELLRDD